MPFVDWKRGREMNESGPAARKGPGTYLAYVREATDGVSEKGDPKITVMLHEVGTDAKLCMDSLMLAGKGLGMGIAKMNALGITEEHGDSVGAEDVMGRKCYVRLVEEESKKLKRDGTPFINLKPDTSAGDGWSCGYRSEDDPPPELDRPDREDTGEQSPTADADGVHRGTGKVPTEDGIPF